MRVRDRNGARYRGRDRGRDLECACVFFSPYPLWQRCEREWREKRKRLNQTGPCCVGPSAECFCSAPELWEASKLEHLSSTVNRVRKLLSATWL